MESKAEEFWEQGDFGYVKKELDTFKTLCKPQIKVSQSFFTLNGKTCGPG